MDGLNTSTVNFDTMLIGIGIGIGTGMIEISRTSNITKSGGSRHEDDESADIFHLPIILSNRPD